MEIKYKDIILRDMIRNDIDDWIRWDTVDTEYMDWDGPDYPSEPVDTEEYRKDMMDFLSQPRSAGFRNFFELATSEGIHIGRINSYALTPEFEDRKWPESNKNESFLAAVGIDICDSRFWGKGFGKQALIAFIQYFLEFGIRDICLQTWTGNVRMVRCAEKIGFVEVNRIIGNRHIRGGIYDGLTFQLDLDKFHMYLMENP